MKNKKFLLAILLSLTACNNKTKTISTLDLEKVVINYKDLPAPVKKKVFPPNNGLITFGEENREEYESFQETNNPKKYEYYTKQDPQLAWVHYPYIRNKKTKQEYSIDKDGPMGSRYIIYGDSLYISNHYNIYEKDSLQYTFTRYILR